MSEHICQVVERTDDTDEHQRRLYRLSDGRLVHHGDLPIGAIYKDQYPTNSRGDLPNPKRPDPDTWSVKLPDGTSWWIDAPSSQGGYWTRSGEAPVFNVSPSIHIQGTRYRYEDEDGPNEKVIGEYQVTSYHGHLLNGKLVSTADSPC